MRRRRGDTDERLDDAAEEREGPPSDIGTMLLSMQEGAGNAAVARVLARVGEGEDAGAVLTGTRPENADGLSEDQLEELSERERRGAEDRATHTALSRRLTLAMAHQFAPRLNAELTAYERRLKDAREYGWLGTDKDVLSSELAEIEARLVKAQEEDAAQQALDAVDGRRTPISERAKKAILEHTALDKPGMDAYAPEDVLVLAELHGKLGALRQQLTDNGSDVQTARGGLGLLSAPATAFAIDAAGKLDADVEKADLALVELEVKLKGIADRHARPNAEDRERLNLLMDGLKQQQLVALRKAMAGGASRQEIDYLIKKAWLEQHDATQKLAKDELWQLITGFSPREGKVSYFDLADRVGKWRTHFSLDYGVMKAVDVGASDQDISDALFGRTAGVVMRSHVTCEVLGRNDDLNPHYYYASGKVSPKNAFLSTPKGKEYGRNRAANDSALIEAFKGKADELVKVVHEVLAAREALKSVVVKVGESLTWAD
jgi:hypothetical protein